MKGKKNLLLIKTLILQMSLRCTFVVPPQVRYLPQSTSPLSSPFRMRRTQQTLPDLTRFNLVIFYLCHSVIGRSRSRRSLTPPHLLLKGPTVHVWGGESGGGISLKTRMDTSSSSCRRYPKQVFLATVGHVTHIVASNQFVFNSIHFISFHFIYTYLYLNLAKTQHFLLSGMYVYPLTCTYRFHNTSCTPHFPLLPACCLRCDRRANDSAIM